MPHVVVVVAAHEQRHFGGGFGQRHVCIYGQVGKSENDLCFSIERSAGAAKSLGIGQVFYIRLPVERQHHAHQSDAGLAAVAPGKFVQNVRGNRLRRAIHHMRERHFLAVFHPQHIAAGVLESALIQALLQQIGVAQIKLVVAESGIIQAHRVEGFHHLQAGNRFATVRLERADKRRTEKIARQHGNGVGIFAQQLFFHGSHASQSARFAAFQGRNFIYIVDLQDSKINGLHRSFAGYPAGRQQEEQGEESPLET